jgi:hypothetical protein
MTIFRNKKDNTLYYLVKVSPRMYSGHYFESINMFTGETRKLNQSSWKLSDFVSVAER